MYSHNSEMTTSRHGSRVPLLSAYNVLSIKVQVDQKKQISHGNNDKVNCHHVSSTSLITLYRYEHPFSKKSKEQQVKWQNIKNRWPRNINLIPGYLHCNCTVQCLEPEAQEKKKKKIKLADPDFPLFTIQLDEVNIKEWKEQASRPADH